MNELVGKPTKFAVSLNTSVPKTTFDRAQKLQRKWDAANMEKYDKPFRMSDLATYVWDIGLGVLEDLDKAQMLDVLSAKKIDRGLIEVEIKKAKHQFKEPKSLANLTDEQVEAMTSEASGGDKE